MGLKKGLNQFLNTILEEDKRSKKTAKNKTAYRVNGVQKQTIKEYNYYLRESILTPKERKFYEVLLKITNPDKFCIQSQVALIEIFQPTRDNYWGSKGKIQHLHIDFVLCRKKDLHPILAIELDDKSHHKQNRSDRDKFLDELFSNFDLNLVHIPLAESYDARKLSDFLTKAIQAK